MIWTNQSHKEYKSTTNLLENKAEGAKSAACSNLPIQKHLHRLRLLLYRHPLIIFALLVIVLALCCFGLKSVTIHSKLNQLWMKGDKLFASDFTKYEEELNEQASYTHQLVIQTSNDPSTPVLTSESLLTHLKVIKAASSVTVNVFNVPWKLKDICYTYTFTNFDVPYVDQIFRHIVPCTIITPLDCFWEGSKLLGPESPVTIPGLSYKLKWTSLNPDYLLQLAKSLDTNFPIKRLEDTMKKAGITTGYQNKPCLNPKDRDCPSTAPNKNSSHKLNIGEELLGGCQGFASKYMQWPEGLILGGVKKNESDHIISAQALQSVIQLMDENDLFEYYKDDYKVQQIHWSPQNALFVLESWQRKFNEEVNRQMNMYKKPSSTFPFAIYSFSTVQLNDILNRFSTINLRDISYGYLVMLIFVVMALFKWKNPSVWEIISAFLIVFLISLTNAAALGFCARIGLPFNLLTIHILPYFGLGLGIWNFFMFINTSSGALNCSHLKECAGTVMEDRGLSVILMSLFHIVASLSATIIPIPALRIFCLQTAILIIFNLVISIFLLQIVIEYNSSLRRKSNIFDCSTPTDDNDDSWSYLEQQTKNTPRTFNDKTNKEQVVTRALMPDRKQTETMLASSNKDEPRFLKSFSKEPQELSASSNLRNRIFKLYTDFLCLKSTRTLAVILVFLSLILSGWSIGRLREGLQLSDVIPPNTKEHSFLLAQEKYFGFYNMFVVTKENFDYGNNQRLLYQYHENFMKFPSVVKVNDEYPPFWLSLFRDWLIGLQKSFDRDWFQGCITREHWFHNASEEGVLAYKLMVQTGLLEKPVDKGQIPHTRLVDQYGLINPNAFYNYLSAWVCNDALAYSASFANLKPEPIPWCLSTGDYQLEIPKSSPLVQAQIPFNVQGLTSTSRITSLISQVQQLCNVFKARGLPNFAFGIPFIFWEHYQQLKQKVCLAICCILTIIFLVTLISLKNIRAALVITIVAAFMIIQNLSLFSFLGIKFNALSSGLLILTVGINMQHVIPACISFITGVGNRERKIELALKQNIPYMFYGFITMTLSFVSLLISDLYLIVWPFLKTLVIINVGGFVNGLLLFPIFLLLLEPSVMCRSKACCEEVFSPSPEVVDNDDAQVRIPDSSSASSFENPNLQTVSKKVTIKLELNMETTIQP